MAKSKSPQPPAPPTTNIQIVCQEPIIVPRDSAPTEETPLPAENTSWPRLILVIVATAAQDHRGDTEAFRRIPARRSPCNARFRMKV